MQVLILQMRRIGDLVLTTPVVRSLRRVYPGVTITLAIEGGSAGLLPCLDHDQALVFHRGRWDVSTWWRLLRSSYDICLDLTGNDRAGLAAWLSSAPRKITFARKRLRRWQRRLFDGLAYSDVARRHTVEHYHAILHPLGENFLGPAPAPELLLPPEDVEGVGEFLRQQGVSEPYVVVHPGTVKAEKYWTAEGWAEVIAGLLAKQRQVVVTGSPAQAEGQHLEAIRQALCERVSEAQRAKGVREVAGQLTLPQLAACLAGAEAVCGVDSAPLHMAEALGRPVCALFGPTCPHQWKPRREGSLTLTPLGRQEVGPEYYPGRPMHELRPEMVVAEIAQWLPTVQGRPIL